MSNVQLWHVTIDGEDLIPFVERLATDPALPEAIRAHATRALENLGLRKAPTPPIPNVGEAKALSGEVNLGRVLFFS
jgi:hypothetical protein